MSNFGLSDLRVVQPHATVLQKWDDVCVPYSVFAKDVLDGSRKYFEATLEEAVGDCALILGTGATSRKKTPAISPRAAAKLVVDHVQTTDPPSSSKVAILLGNERFGMSSEEIDLCSHTINIQTDAPLQKERNVSTSSSSLNLSHAGIIFFYEIFTCWKEREGDFRSIPEQSTRQRNKPLDYNTKQRLRDVLLESRKLLDVVNLGGVHADDDDRENLTGFIARNQLSAKDASVLFSIAQRVIALGALTKNSVMDGKMQNNNHPNPNPNHSLLEPALVEALARGGETSASAEHIKERVRELCPTLSLDKEEFQWLLERKKERKETRKDERTNQRLML